jgi:hypothetical protein
MIKTKTIKFESKSLGSKIIGLFKSQNQLGILTYTSSFTKDNGTIVINNTDISTFESKGFLKSEIHIVRDCQTVFSTILKFAGNLEIQSNLDNKKYWLKQKDFWRDIKVLVDETGKELLLLSKKFNWKKFNYEYSFVATNDFEFIPEKELLLLSLLQGEQKRQMNITIMITVFMIVFSATNH